MNLNKITLPVALVLMASCAAPAINSQSASVVPDHQVGNPWYAAGQSAVTDRLPATARAPAKNVILFIGDGMGVTTVTAARILQGQMNGGFGEENSLSFEYFPHTGMAKTYNVDAQVSDSAGTATALVSGVKTDIGVLGIDEDVVYGECDSARGHELTTILELAELAGRSTGIVTTTRVTHATPAAAYAKSPDRDWENDFLLTEAAVKSGCKDIAVQLVEFEQSLQERFAGHSVNGLEVLMGGGRRNFLPEDAQYNSGDQVSEIEGDRTDGRDLTAEWQAAYPDGAYVIDEAGLDALADRPVPHLLGLFNESHMRYEADRHNDIRGEPSLAKMTTTAIRQLGNNPAGFFLLVEGGRIDHGHHAGSAHAALTDTIAFADAVQAAVDSVNLQDTLIIVTADHSHPFTISGYPRRGNPILGKVIQVGQSEIALAEDDLPYTTLGYANGPGFRDFGDDETDADSTYHLEPDAGRKDLTGINTESPGFHQEALVPFEADLHGGEDVVVYGVGPGAEAVSGTIEQNVVFHVMLEATGWGEMEAQKGLQSNLGGR